MNTKILLLVLAVFGMCLACAPAVQPDRAALLAVLVQAPESREAHVAYLKELIRVNDPDRAMVGNEMFIVASFTGDYPEDWPEYMHSLGSVLNHQAWHLIVNERDTAYAEALVQKAMILDPDEPDYIDTLAELRFRQGRADEAVALIDKALQQTADRGRPMGKGKIGYLEKQKARFLERQ